MIEPTESEDKDELDRFCDAMIQIKMEIDAVAEGKLDAEDNPLKNSPHTLHEVTADEWPHSYSRQVAAYPLPWVMNSKFWASSNRVNNSYGDRHLVCTCPPISEYQQEELAEA
jgi:glycine dehydrogenase